MFDDYIEEDEEFIDVDTDLADMMGVVSAPTLKDSINTSEVIKEDVINPNVEVNGNKNITVGILNDRVEVKNTEVISEREIGDYNSKVPKLPEDIDVFDMRNDNIDGEYKSKTLLVTKRFKEFRYPQLIISDKILQHKYMVTSLKALICTKPQSVKKEDELCFDVIIPFENGVVVRLGTMLGRNLNNFLSTPVFKDIEKSVLLDEDTEIFGNMLFALCIGADED